MHADDIVILAAARTPLGAFQGAPADVPSPRLGAAAIRGALERGGVAAGEVTDVFMGKVIQAGVGQAPARQAALLAGVPAGPPGGWSATRGRRG